MSYLHEQEQFCNLIHYLFLSSLSHYHAFMLLSHFSQGTKQQHGKYHTEYERDECFYCDQKYKFVV